MASRLAGEQIAVADRAGVAALVNRKLVARPVRRKLVRYASWNSIFERALGRRGWRRCRRKAREVGASNVVPKRDHSLLVLVG